MHKRAIIALAALSLSGGAALYAADDSTRGASQSQSRGSAVSGENSTPSSGRMGTLGDSNYGSSSVGGDAWSAKHRSDTSVNRSVDTTKSDPRHMSSSRNVAEDRDTTGARTGGYLAAGIGIAALIGLFASRRNRVSRVDRYDDDDYNRPSRGPRV